MIQQILAYIMYAVIIGALFYCMFNWPVDEAASTRPKQATDGKTAQPPHRQIATPSYDWLLYLMGAICFTLALYINMFGRPFQ